MAKNSSGLKHPTPLEPACKKTIYNSQEEAQDMINYIREIRTVRDIRPYKCNICGFWHLTSRTK
jgi:hypothetical protein